MSPRRAGLSEVWKVTGDVLREMELWLESRDGKRYNLQYRPLDRARLTRLYTWSLRYYLPIEDILDLIIPVLRGQRRYDRKRWGIGLTVRTLTSYGAERILRKELEKKYPDGEHVAQWRDREREKQLEAECLEGLDGLIPRENGFHNVLEAGSPMEYMARYRSQVLRQRAIHQRAYSMERRRLKPYRWNPWR
jgi:hypothetical protein